LLKVLWLSSSKQNAKILLAYAQIT